MTCHGIPEAADLFEGTPGEETDAPFIVRLYGATGKRSLHLLERFLKKKLPVM